MFEVLLYCWNYFESVFIFLLTLVYIFIILQCHGDIERNPGPGKLKTNSFSACHWNMNMNSLPVNNFSKHAQIKACNSIYKYGFILVLFP